MSVYYSVYAEANVDGKWYSRSPLFKTGKDDLRTHSIFWLQSLFYEVYNDLKDYALGYGIPDDMSVGLREVFRETLDEEIEYWPGKLTWGDYYRQNIYYINFERAIASKVKKDKPYKYEGYVQKKELASFEIDEIDEFSEWLTQKEYDALTPKEKRQYQYYRWNDPYGEYWIYQALTERIRTLAVLFAVTCESDIGGSLYNGISDSEIRVYIYRS